MKIGIPQEIKTHEYRVGLTPQGARELITEGHSVVVEQGCGQAIGFHDEDYQQAGATIVTTARELYQSAELIVKVKEPQTAELSLLQAHHSLFAYLHLAADKSLLEGLLNTGALSIAYETVTDDQGNLPLLTPMSEVAGRLATQIGSHYLEKTQGGHGVLLGAVTGTAPAKVTVLGGGVVGRNAAEVALGMGAEVTLLDLSEEVLSAIQSQLPGIHPLLSSPATVEQSVMGADLVVGAVLVPGGKAPQVVSEKMIKKMKEGAVIVDVAIDQGGCFASSAPTSHDNPTYQKHGITHYCVTNIPSAAAYTATMALTQATLPYIKQLANEGIETCLGNNPHLRRGLNTYNGKITYQALAESFGLEWCNAESLF